ATVAKRPFDYPNRLMQADIEIQADAVCRRRHSYGKSFKAASMLCAGTTQKPMIDSCYGDSGGPLFAQTASGPVEVGIVSWGRGCAQLGFPGVYARLSDPGIADWIRATMR
ncbi:MAG TPA: trypsin-like serine protease, partial [Thermomicrobiales bacterium]|nr:trypsin-like serine protease [Thermomicrobiales bacterium]